MLRSCESAYVVARHLPFSRVGHRPERRMGSDRHGVRQEVPQRLPGTRTSHKPSFHAGYTRRASTMARPAVATQAGTMTKFGYSDDASNVPADRIRGSDSRDPYTHEAALRWREPPGLARLAVAVMGLPDPNASM